MADASTPETPDTPVVTPVTGAADPAPRRTIWPFVLGGGILLAVLVIGGLVLAVSAVLGVFGSDPKKSVTDYDLSFEKVDCELFQSVTTTSFQDAFFNEPFDCSRWVDNAESLTADGEYLYDVKIVISKTDGDTAEVVTQETDRTGESPQDYTLRYYLLKTEGRWLIDGINDEG